MNDDIWETFCDEAYFHMWCLRKIGQHEIDDGFHINSREEAIALCDLLNKMERELAEARRQEKIHFDNCASMREQRDGLAAALSEAWLLMDKVEGDDEIDSWQNKYAYPLATMKGGKDE